MAIELKRLKSGYYVADYKEIFSHLVLNKFQDYATLCEDDLCHWGYGVTRKFLKVDRGVAFRWDKSSNYIEYIVQEREGVAPTEFKGKLECTRIDTWCSPKPIEEGQYTCLKTLWTKLEDNPINWKEG